MEHCGHNGPKEKAIHSNSNEDVYNMKDYVHKFCPNLKTATNGTKINWNSIRWVQVRRSAPNSLFVNYGFLEENFFEIKFQTKTRQKTTEKLLQPAYKGKIPISAAKKKDLVMLCEKNIIPGVSLLL